MLAEECGLLGVPFPDLAGVDGGTHREEAAGGVFEGGFGEGGQGHDGDGEEGGE